MKATFPVPVDKFFEFFFSDEAIFSLGDHRKTRNDFEVQLGKWATTEDGTAYQRELNTIIKLVDVPFKDRSRMTKF